jgi:hypothetical protein
MVNPKLFPIPMNLPLLLNDPRPKALAALAEVLNGGLDTPHQLQILSRCFKIKVWFEKPLYFKTVHSTRVIEKNAEGGWTRKEHIYGVTTDCHIFNRICLLKAYQDRIFYCKSKNARMGYDFPIEHMTRWEPVPPPRKRKDS